MRLLSTFLTGIVILTTLQMVSRETYAAGAGAMRAIERVAAPECQHLLVAGHDLKVRLQEVARLVVEATNAREKSAVVAAGIDEEISRILSDLKVRYPGHEIENLLQAEIQTQEIGNENAIEISNSARKSARKAEGLHFHRRLFISSDSRSAIQNRHATPDGKFLVLWSERGLDILDGRTSELMRSIDGKFGRSIRFSQSGEFALLYDITSHGFQVVSLRNSFQVVSAFHAFAFESAEISNDGSVMAEMYGSLSNNRASRPDELEHFRVYFSNQFLQTNSNGPRPELGRILLRNSRSAFANPGAFSVSGRYFTFSDAEPNKLVIWDLQAANTIPEGLGAAAKIPARDVARSELNEKKIEISKTYRYVTSPVDDSVFIPANGCDAQIVDLVKGRSKMNLDGFYQQARFSADGTRLGVVTSENKFVVIQVSDGKVLLEQEIPIENTQPRVRTFDISADLKHVLVRTLGYTLEESIVEGFQFEENSEPYKFFLSGASRDMVPSMANFVGSTHDRILIRRFKEASLGLPSADPGTIELIEVGEDDGK